MGAGLKWLGHTHRHASVLLKNGHARTQIVFAQWWGPKQKNSVSMSRGRGRGRGSRLKLPEGLSWPQGETPRPILQPPPLYPPLERKPLDLKTSEVDGYLVSVKQDLRQYVEKSPFYLLQRDSKSGNVDRYSDKYKKNGESHGGLGWEVDWDYFPRELRILPRRKEEATMKKRRRRRKELVVKRSGGQEVGGEVSAEVSGGGGGGGVKYGSDLDEEEVPRAKKRRVMFDDSDAGGVARVGEGGGGGGLVKKLESLEKAELSAVESEHSGGEEEEEVYDEYEDEEGTDYNLTYFDNGEDYDIADDEALEEGPVY